MKIKKKQAENDDAAAAEKEEKGRSKSASPGVIRKALKTLRSPGKHKKKSTQDDEEEEQLEVEPPPPTVEARVDSVLKSIASQRSSSLKANEKQHSSASRPSFSSTDDSRKSNEDSCEADASNTGKEQRREYLITEHSNRTLVMDNKRHKSQSTPLPDAPWSNRNFPGSSKPDNKFHSSSKQASLENDGDHHHEAQYGTLALKGDAEETNESSTQRRSRSSSGRSSSIRKERSSTARSSDTSSGDSQVTDWSRRPRRSPGNLNRRKCSINRLDPPSREIPDAPPDIDDGEAEDEIEPPSVGMVRQPPRSFSAGQISNDKLKSRSTRASERKARSQSPTDGASQAPRRIRSGRKKNDKSDADETDEDIGMAIADGHDIEHDGEKEADGSEAAKDPKTKIRGRSPGSLKGRREHFTSATEEIDEQAAEPPHTPISRELSTRGRSPGTLRENVSNQDAIPRDKSPGRLRRQTSRHSRSPGSLRKNAYSSRTRSPGRLSIDRSSGHSANSGTRSSGRLSIDKSSGHSANSGSRSPGRLSIDRASGHSANSGSAPVSPPRRKSSNPGDSMSPAACAKSRGSIDDIPFEPSDSSDIVFEPPPPLATASGVEASTPRRTRPIRSASSDEIMPNLGIPRSKSPGALARRPAKNLRTTQQRKAQSLFEKRSKWTGETSPTAVAPNRSSTNTNALVSPRRKSSTVSVSKTVGMLYDEGKALSAPDAAEEVKPEN